MTDRYEKIRSIADRFKDLTRLGFANIAATAIGAIFWFFIATLVGAEHYGQISYVIAVSGIAGVICMMGASNTITVYTAKGERILPSVSIISISSSLVGSLIMFFIMYNLGASLYVVGYAVFTLVTADLLGMKSYKDYSRYVISQRLLMIVLALALYYIMGYNGVVVGISLSFFPYMIRLIKQFRSTGVDFSVIKSKSKFMINTYVLDLSRMFAGQTDKLVIAPLFGFTLLGNYQLGIQFLSMLTLIPNIVYQYTLPQDASGNPNKKLKRLTIISSIVIALLGAFISPIIIPNLFPKFEHATRVIQIISFAVIPNSVILMYISKFLGNLKTKIVLSGSLIYLVIQVTTIITLGRVFGIDGVALAIVLAYGSEAIYLIVIDRHVKIEQTFSTTITTTEDSVIPISDNILDTKKEIANKKASSGFSEGVKKLCFFFERPVIALPILGAIAVILRLYTWTPTIPLTLDALEYFWYANDASILGHIPSWGIENNGWPLFLSLFFSIYHSNNFMDYMMLQRLITVSLSVLTMIPVYLLCSRFFKQSYSIIGTALFVFEPRILQNSFFGITDPLYVMLVACAFLFLFRDINKVPYISFAIAGLSSLVRAEGLFLFLALSVVYLLRNKKERRVIVKYFLAVVIFILLILPLAIVRIQLTGTDHLTSRIAIEGQNIVTASQNTSALPYLHGFESPVEFLGRSMIPVLMFFVPLGFLLMLKNRNRDVAYIIISIIIISVPAFYAVLRLPDTRYFFPLYPLFCIVSLYTVLAASKKLGKEKVFLTLLICGILLSSTVFLYFKNINVEHEKEALNLAFVVDNTTSGINPYLPESRYLPIPLMTNHPFPALSSSFSAGPKIITTDGFTDLRDYIESGKDRGLTHLVVDSGANRPHFLYDVFYHEQNYPYLVKIFDSWDKGYKYHLKIYRIDYDKLESVSKTILP